MHKLYFWLFLQLALSSPKLFAQNSNTQVTAISKILSASSSGQNVSGSLNVSIGAIHYTLYALNPENTVSKTLPQDTVISSKLLTTRALLSMKGEAPEKNLNRLESNPEITAAIKVYPNPFVDQITLYIDASSRASGSNLRYALLDISGNPIKTGLLKPGEKEITMGNVPKGAYLLALFQNDQQINSFKLLKNNL